MASAIAQKIGKMFAGQASVAANEQTRSVAKDRLSVILASQRGSELLQGVDMEALQKDVLAVVKKHSIIAKNKPVQVQVNSDGDISLMEMCVELDSPGPRAPGGPTSN
jgi:cell division topological specificity factor MinE